MARKGVLTRDVKKKECPWLMVGLKKGRVVYEYTGYTYGVCGPTGVMVSDEANQTSSYEIPRSSVEWEI